MQFPLLHAVRLPPSRAFVGHSLLRHFAHGGEFARPMDFVDAGASPVFSFFVRQQYADTAQSTSIASAISWCPPACADSRSDHAWEG